MFNNKRMNLIELRFNRFLTINKKQQRDIEELEHEVAKLQSENNALHAELTTLKAGKQPKAADNMPEIVSCTDYYRMTFRDENGSIKTQVEVTPDRVIATANKITLNGADISSAQI